MLGLGAAATELFALPFATYGLVQTGVYYGQVHDFVTAVNGRALDRFYGGLAQSWWDWGLLLAGALLVVLVAVAVATPAPRAVGLLITLVAVAAGVLHAVALGTSPDLREAQVLFRKGHSMYEHAAGGVWVSFAGFVVLAVAGLLLTLGPRRH